MMKNTFGNSLSVCIFGESHGRATGIVIDGLAPGIDVDEKTIAAFLEKRRPKSDLDTARREPDDFEILSGVFNGRSTGTPLAIIIPNTDTKSSDYEYGKARPSHADYSAFMKYHGFEDYRGGGHFSGRITASLVAAGGVLIPALDKLGISIETCIEECGGVKGEKEIEEAILRAKSEGDSLGGITKTVINGLPAGLGEPWFDSIESGLSHMMFSIGAVKGVEFGSGFAMAKMRGSEANDAFGMEDGSVKTLSNNNGGINGGITNGMPVVFRCAVKPTPSIAKEQQSVDFVRNEDIKLSIKGRHDPAIVRRICPVIDSAAAIVIADMLCVRYGTDVLAKGYR